METKIITVSLKSKEIQEATAPRSRKSHRREVVHLRMVACLVAAVAAVSTIALAASGTETEVRPTSITMRTLLRDQPPPFPLLEGRGIVFAGFLLCHGSKKGSRKGAGCGADTAGKEELLVIFRR